MPVARNSAPAGDPVASLLDGDMVDRLRRLELFSSRRVEGGRTGDNPSPLKGFSSDFLQHRQYFHGDSLRHLDWRVLAKSDRLMVKQYEEITNAEMTLVIDASGSMGYAGQSMSKLEFAVRCSSILFYIMHLQQDVFSLFVFNEKVADRIPPGGSRRQLRRVFEKLVSLEAAGLTAFDACVREMESRVRRKGIVVVFSDFMDDPAQIAKSFGRLRLRGHDVLAFQVADPSEKDLEFNSFTRFKDMEDGETIGVDPLLIRSEYKRQFEIHQKRLKECFLSHAVDFTILPVSDEYEKLIGDYLRHRMSIMR